MTAGLAPSSVPVQDIGRSSQTGAATVILSGISVGLESSVYSAVLLGAAVYGAFLIGGGIALYAVALAGCGLLTTAGVIVSMDTFGPVSDNAQGIAISTAVLAATALFGSYYQSILEALDIAGAEASEAINGLQLVSPNNIVGAILGAAVVFFFSGLAIRAVSRAGPAS